MKTLLVVPLVGLAISFALPTFGQLKEVADPQIRQQLEAAQGPGGKYDVAFNKNDAAAIGVLFAPDAVETGPDGVFIGQAAIQKRYADDFSNWHPTDHVNTIQQMYLLDDKAVVINKWSVGGYKGYVTIILTPKGNDWLVQVADYSINSTPTQNWVKGKFVETPSSK
jgi:ketosteroid isomerase-like protein